MRKKRVLLSAPSFMNIYKDIIECLELKGFDVTWVSSEQAQADNPFTLIFTNCYCEAQVSKYLSQVESIWKFFFESDGADYYDYFLAIDGLMVCPYLFEKLRKDNPSVRCVLFLYDKIDVACKVDSFFKYYDGVYSFDKGDCEKYNLNFLPIYWVPAKQTEEIKYDIFGFGTYNLHKPDRTKLFRDLKKMARKNEYRDFIKLYHPVASSKQLLFKNFLCMLIKREYYLPFHDILSDLVIGKSQSPDEFRASIMQSKAIIDTQAPYQDGMTARFMWALGLGKKIITTNEAIKQYPFYNSNQFFVLNNNVKDIPYFLSKEYSVSEENQRIIDGYRIDNWINTMFCFNGDELK